MTVAGISMEGDWNGWISFFLELSSCKQKRTARKQELF